MTRNDAKPPAIKAEWRQRGQATILLQPEIPATKMPLPRKIQSGNTAFRRVQKERLLSTPFYL
jgi:hypothetical protein